MMDKLKKRWGISSNFQILKIFIVFGITGSTAAWISEPLCNIFGITTDNLNIIIYWFVRIVLICCTGSVSGAMLIPKFLAVCTTVDLN